VKKTQNKGYYDSSLPLQQFQMQSDAGKCLRGEDLVWLIGAVFASCCRGSNRSLARSMDGCISAAAPLALADQLPLPTMMVKHSWSGFIPVRRAVSLALAF